MRYAKENGYPCDGIVFKFDDIEYGKSLGQTSHHMKNGIAFKRKDDTYKTKLIDIDSKILIEKSKSAIMISKEEVEVENEFIEKNILYYG